MEQKLDIKTRDKNTMIIHHEMNTMKLQKNYSKPCGNTTYMKTEFRDRKHRMIIHQLKQNETVIKSKYENNGYWL